MFRRNYCAISDKTRTELSDPSFAYPGKNGIIMNDAYDSNVSPIFIADHEVYHITQKIRSTNVCFLPLSKPIRRKINSFIYSSFIF